MDCDRAGTFRGVISECGLYEPDSGAKAINIAATFSEYWNDETETWEDYSLYGMVAKGSIWVIKKDGTVNTKAVESAVQCAGWNGDLVSAQAGIFGTVEKPCQFVVNEELPNDYHKDTQYRIAFLNDFDRTPGGIASNVTPDRAKTLQAQYGSQFRALAGNAARNAVIPATKPTAPKTPPTKAPAKKEPFPDPNAQTQSDLPPWEDDDADGGMGERV